MQLNCPNCGAKVTAENINIHKSTAVCGACDTIFSFDLPETKIKRRKVKQPVKLTVRDSETLHMEFPTHFKLGQNETFIISLVASAVMLGFGLMFTGLMARGLPIFMPGFFFAIAAALGYGSLVTAVNKTHIEMDEDTIKISRKPIPNPFSQEHEVSLVGMTGIKYEETETSKKEGYDIPRYRVWAETTDGNRRVIVSDVVEEYAVFIAQRLEERRLQSDVEPDVSRLEESVQSWDDDAGTDNVARASQKIARE